MMNKKSDPLSRDLIIPVIAILLLLALILWLNVRLDTSHWLNNVPFYW